MISYLISLVQFSPATGRAGRCRQISLCVDSTHSVPATRGLPRTGVSVLSLSILLRLLAALYGVGPALSAVPVFGSSTKAQIRLRLRVVSSPASAVQAASGLLALSPCAVCLFPPRRAAQAARGWRALSHVRRAFSLCGPSARRWSGLRKSLDRNRGPVCSVGGGGFSGAEFAPFPSPLPPSSSGDGPALSQSLCFANRRWCVPAG